MTTLDTLVKQSESQHGFWLVNHREIIEDDLKALLKQHGLIVTCSILNETGNPIVKAIYKKIETVKELVEAAEYNEKHEDDYFNAGGFFAHWAQYTAEEKASFISKAVV